MRAHPVLRAVARRLGLIALPLTVALAAADAAPPQKPRGQTVKVAARLAARKAATTRRKPARTARATARPRPAADPVADLPPLPIVDVAALAALSDPGGATTPALAGAPYAAAVPATASLSEAAKPFEVFSRSATSMLESLAARARSQLGTRYVLGGDSPGGALDCSSFTRFAMEALGVRLPRTAAQQARVGVAVPRDRERLRPGDLLTFGSRRKVSHVGIYLGEGRFIHASVTSGRVIETTFAKNARLFRRWLGARRLLADADSASARAGG